MISRPLRWYNPSHSDIYPLIFPLADGLAFPRLGLFGAYTDIYHYAISLRRAVQTHHESPASGDAFSGRRDRHRPLFQHGLHHFHHRCARHLAGLPDWRHRGLSGDAVPGRIVGRHAGNRRFPCVRSPLSWPGNRLYRGLALLVNLDRRTGFQPDGGGVLHAVLVPAIAGVAVVPDLLYHHLPAERHYHPLFCRKRVLVFPDQSGDHTGVYHPGRRRHVRPAADERRHAGTFPA